MTLFDTIMPLTATLRGVTQCFVLLAVSVFQTMASECTTDTKQDKKALNMHKIGSLNLLVFVCLLILIVLTIWLFKKHRVRFLHETGLSIVYGLIIGALINYTIEIRTEMLNVNHTAVNVSLDDFDPPDIIRLDVAMGDTNQSNVYRYGYQSKVTNSDLEAKATFDPEIFFNIILPPIIFNAGYDMKRKHFFRNFGAIVTYAFLGTTMSSFLIGGVMYGVSLLFHIHFVCFTDCLLFGTIISATDPVTVLAIFHDLHVDMDLYALVFGESVLNDAVAIVLAETIEDYGGGGFDGTAILVCLGQFLAIFLGSTLLGAALGCLNALLTKLTHIKDFPLLETSLFVLMSYGTFVAAEACKLSGIVAVLFCGICQAHYTFNNLSPESKARTKQIFELLNFLMENFVFAYIGVATFTFRQHVFNVYFILFAFIAILVARALNIYPLTFLVNLGRDKSKRIPWNFQHMLMYSGLRGAMAFALAMRNTSTRAHQMVLSTTMLIVISTVILCGGFTTQALQSLHIRVGVDQETELQHSARATDPDGTMTAPISGRLHDKTKVVRVWYGIDARFFKPLLTHARPPLTETLPHWCQRVARILTTTEQLTQTGTTGTAGTDADTQCVLDDTDDIISSQQLKPTTSFVSAAANNLSTAATSSNPGGIEQSADPSDITMDDLRTTADDPFAARY